jgi:hypothetical protein
MSFYDDIDSEDWKQKLLARWKKEEAKKTPEQKANEFKEALADGDKENESIEVIMETILMNYKLYMEISDMPVLKDIEARNMQVRKMAKQQYNEWHNVLRQRYIDEYFKMTGKKLK